MSQPSEQRVPPPEGGPSRPRRLLAFTEAGRARWACAALALTLLPGALMLIGLWLKEARGPFWLGTNSDPDYTFLINSLIAAQFGSPDHFDHPGTTLQVLGALVLRMSHALWGDGTLEDDVLEDPEYYLTNIHLSLLALGAVAHFATGALCLWYTRSLLLAVVSQLPPFLSVTTLFTMSGVWVEPLLFFLTLGFATLTLLYPASGPEGRPRLFALLFGLLTGAALATKLTALPLAALPLVLLPWRWKPGYLALSVGSFLLATLPIIPKYGGLAEWLLILGTHTGAYGEGDEGFIDPAKYRSGLWSLAQGESILFVILLVNVATLVACRLLRRRFPPPVATDESARRGLWAVTLTQVLQVLLVAKQPDERYLIPALGLLGVNLIFLGRLIFTPAGKRVRVALALLCAAGFSSAGVLQYQSVIRWHDSSVASREAQEELLKLLETRAHDSRLLFSYGASSPVYALWFGNRSTWSLKAGRPLGRYAAKLQALYPDGLFYDIEAKVFCSFAEELEVERLLAGKRPVLLLGQALLGSLAHYAPDGVILEPISPREPTEATETLYRLRSP